MLSFIFGNMKQPICNFRTSQLQFIFLVVSILGGILGCGNSANNPDVSAIKVEIEVVRFERDFFAIDTLDLNKSMEILRSTHHDFSNDFILRILGLEGIDTSDWSKAIKQFHHDYYPIYDSTKKLEVEINKSIADTKEGLQYVKYYFPKYKLPEQFITFIGPIDAFASGPTGGSGDIITTHGLGAGLQLHLGANSMVYNNEQGMQLYPNYISKKFSTAYIPVNAMKNIIDDLYPPIKQGGSLLDIIVDHGKRMYLLDLFLPEAEDTLKLGYSASQLKGALKNEGLIWNYFIENKLLYESDDFKIRSFINDAPSTVEFGEGSPGFISLFIGRQMILAYMKKNNDTNLNTLLSLDARKVLSGSSYKPR